MQVGRLLAFASSTTSKLQSANLTERRKESRKRVVLFPFSEMRPVDFSTFIREDHLTQILRNVHFIMQKTLRYHPNAIFMALVAKIKRY